MSHTLEDRQQINDLITGWMHRDLGNWDELRKLFHPDGTVAVTWFEGLASDFVDGSIRMGASTLRNKHFIANPVVTFQGDKAIAETNSMIIGEDTRLNLGATSHARFYDLVEKRDGQWKLFKRQAIYDMGYFTFPLGPVEIDSAVEAKYPREYASLAYLLEKAGFPLGRVFATRGSDLERQMREHAKAWLNA